MIFPCGGAEEAGEDEAGGSWLSGGACVLAEDDASVFWEEISSSDGSGSRPAAEDGDTGGSGAAE